MMFRLHAFSTYVKNSLFKRGNFAWNPKTFSRRFSTLNEPLNLKYTNAVSNNLVKPGYELKVGYWLLGCAGFTFGLMTIGAYVRLRESGLSMLNWKFWGLPLPSNEEEWLHEYENYKKTPEYKVVHPDITLEGYKNIFINEWVHRMAGRATGVFFGTGALFFILTNAFRPRGYLLLTCLSGLGVSQAFIGKWMVDSGFIPPTTENKTPRVSPYRLTVHFLDAFLIYTLCVWNGLKLLSKGGNLAINPEIKSVGRLGRSTALFAFLTIIYGTIVAGNDAGIGYNTWPKMLDRYVPEEVYNIKDCKQLFENTAIVQFNHRTLAYLTVLSSIMTFIKSRGPNIPRNIRKKSIGVLHTSLLQLAFGILTVVKSVPVHAALAHHINGMLLWTMLLSLLRLFK